MKSGLNDFDSTPLAANPEDAVCRRQSLLKSELICFQAETKMYRNHCGRKQSGVLANASKL